MSEQPLDLRGSLRMVRRHKILVLVCAALGLLAGVCYTVLRPPMPVSNALVVLPPTTHNVATQIVIATSDPVLADVLHVPGHLALIVRRAARVGVLVSA